MDYDFSGYVTKNDLLCSDGRTIRSGAFRDQDGMQVPLVWNHGHHDVSNVLGHVLLENRADGVYGYAKLNNSSSGMNAKELVKHKDVESFSIYANELFEKAKNVLKGKIREVSLVLNGANPGAFIDNIVISHGDDEDILASEAIIYTGLFLEHSYDSGTDEEELATDTEEKEEEVNPKIVTNDVDDEDILEHADADSELTVQDVFDSMNENQKNVLYFMIGEALNNSSESAQHSDNTDALQHGQEGTLVHNIFENNDGQAATMRRPVLTHAQIDEIVADAKKNGSLKESFLSHAATYGIEDIELLFPDAKALTSTPELLARRTEWVSDVMSGTRHSPFSRIKSVVFDLTADEARAKGYVKGAMKKEEVIALLRRKTGPTTIYKKQKLDRDDIVDITDLDVVAFLKGEMRLMLDEEIARAILLGDGRSAGDDDKIDELSIRPIAKDDAMYAYPVTLAANVSVSDRVEALIRARSEFRGTGQPMFFTTLPFITDILLLKDKMGRRLYDNLSAVSDALMVSKIVTVEVMESDPSVVGIMVNLADYTIGADRGGEVNMFDDFDIDYNQQKYLMETRISGALTKPRAAIVVKRATGTPVTPTSPSFDGATNKITIPSITGVVYTIDGTAVTGTVTITENTDVEAHAASGYTIVDGSNTFWSFVYTEL